MQGATSLRQPCGWLSATSILALAQRMAMRPLGKWPLARLIFGWVMASRCGVEAPAFGFDPQRRG